MSRDLITVGGSTLRRLSRFLLFFLSSTRHKTIFKKCKKKQHVTAAVVLYVMNTRKCTTGNVHPSLFVSSF